MSGVHDLWLPGDDRLEDGLGADGPGLRATDIEQHALRRDDCRRRLREWKNIRYPPPRCGVNSCPECARDKARKLARAIALTLPDFTMTLTTVGQHFPTIQRGVEKVLRAVRRRSQFKIAWVVECNGQEREGHAHHLHGACHGVMPDPGLVSEKAQGAGFGWLAEVDPVRDNEAWGEYLFKQVRRGDLQHHLEMNGGQLIHTSDRFYRINGMPVRGGLDVAYAEGRSQGLVV